ncbi:unnamed protein product [Gadus morhua 'NCC']
MLFNLRCQHGHRKKRGKDAEKREGKQALLVNNAVFWLVRRLSCGPLETANGTRHREQQQRAGAPARGVLCCLQNESLGDPHPSPYLPSLSSLSALSFPPQPTPRGCGLSSAAGGTAKTVSIERTGGGGGKANRISLMGRLQPQPFSPSRSAPAVQPQPFSPCRSAQPFSPAVQPQPFSRVLLPGNGERDSL